MNLLLYMHINAVFLTVFLLYSIDLIIVVTIMIQFSTKKVISS
jgi:hypothetical protein